MILNSVSYYILCACMVLGPVGLLYYIDRRAKQRTEGNRSLSIIWVFVFVAIAGGLFAGHEHLISRLYVINAEASGIIYVEEEFMIGSSTYADPDSPQAPATSLIGKPDHIHVINKTNRPFAISETVYVAEQTTRRYNNKEEEDKTLNDALIFKEDVLVPPYSIQSVAIDKIDYMPGDAIPSEVKLESGENIAHKYALKHVDY